MHISISGSQEDNKKEERDSTYSPSSESDGTSDTDSAYSDEIEVREQAKKDIQKFYKFGPVCVSYIKTIIYITFALQTNKHIGVSFSFLFFLIFSYSVFKVINA